MPTDSYTQQAYEFYRAYILRVYGQEAATAAAVAWVAEWRRGRRRREVACAAAFEEVFGPGSPAEREAGKAAREETGDGTTGVG
jgi:hypothetical protein